VQAPASDAIQKICVRCEIKRTASFSRVGFASLTHPLKPPLTTSSEVSTQEHQPGMTIRSLHAFVRCPPAPFPLVAPSHCCALSRAAAMPSQLPALIMSFTDGRASGPKTQVTMGRKQHIWDPCHDVYYQELNKQQIAAWKEAALVEKKHKAELAAKQDVIRVKERELRAFVNLSKEAADAGSNKKTEKAMLVSQRCLA